MGISVWVLSRNVVLWDYLGGRGKNTIEYIARTNKDFYLEKEKIRSKQVKQFKYIGEGAYTIFNFKQVNQLLKEIAILEEEKTVSSEILEIIKKGIEKILKNNDLYLKFEDD